MAQGSTSSLPQSLKDDLEERLSCALCMEIFNEKDRLPKLLPCAHTLCSRCLTNLMKKASKMYVCPFCREQIGTLNALSKFKTNWSMVDMLTLLQNKRRTEADSESVLVQTSCSIHTHSSCTCLCLTCSEPLCTTCLLEEMRDPKHKDHEIVDINILKDEPADQVFELVDDDNDDVKVKRKGSVCNTKRDIEEEWEECCSSHLSGSEPLDHVSSSDAETDSEPATRSDVVERRGPGVAHPTRMLSQGSSVMEGEQVEPWEFVEEEDAEGAEAITPRDEELGLDQLVEDSVSALQSYGIDPTPVVDGVKYACSEADKVMQEVEESLVASERQLEERANQLVENCSRQIERGLDNLLSFFDP